MLKSELLHFPRHNFITADEQKYLINLLAIQLLGHLMRKKWLFQIQDQEFHMKLNVATLKYFKNFTKYGTVDGLIYLYELTKVPN